MEGLWSHVNRWTEIRDSSLYDNVCWLNCSTYLPVCHTIICRSALSYSENEEWLVRTTHPTRMQSKTRSALPGITSSPLAWAEFTSISPISISLSLPDCARGDGTGKFFTCDISCSDFSTKSVAPDYMKYVIVNHYVVALSPLL